MIPPRIGPTIGTQNTSVPSVRPLFLNPATTVNSRGPKMRARYAAGNVASHGDAQSPSERDVGEAAMHDFPGRTLPEEHHHRYHAGAEENQNQGAEKFSQEFRQIGRLHVREII